MAYWRQLRVSSENQTRKIILLIPLHFAFFLHRLVGGQDSAVPFTFIALNS